MRRVRRAAAAWVFDEHGRVLLIRENYGRRRYGPSAEAGTCAAARRPVVRTDAPAKPARPPGRRRVVDALGPPGGAVEDGESPREAVCREVREETCSELEVDGIVGVYRFEYPTGRRPQWTAFAFTGRLSGKPRVPETGEIAALGWFDPDALPHPITNLTRYGLADAVAGRRALRRRIRVP